MNYWPAEICNLSMCHEPLFDLLERMVKNGRRTAMEMYGCRGFVAHHNTDIWADTAPQDLALAASYWVMGGAWLAALVNFIYAFVPTILGIITLALINMGKFSADKFASVGARYALPVLAMNTMPALICGLLFAGIISATMSSSDSDLLGAGSIFANDIYKAVLKPDASSQSVMNVTKIVMCLVGVASMFIALFNTQSIVSILMFCFTLRAAGSFFPYVMGHYWKKASKAGTIASLLAGTIVVVYLEHISGGVLFGIKFSQPIIPGLVAAFIGFIVFSKIMPPEHETTELAPEEDD